LGYADIDHAGMSKATSFSAVAQQLSLASGVAIAAAVVEETRGLSLDARIGPQDFPPAFFVVAAIAAASTLVFMRLPHNAGAALSGHKSTLVE
jgi:hypothetical protein